MAATQARLEAIGLIGDLPPLLAASWRQGLPSTKFAPPSQATPWIDRQHILEPLANAQHKKIVLVTAPAGYGKTVLVSQYYHLLAKNGRAAGWISIDSNDADPTAMLSCLVQAVSLGLGGAFDEASRSSPLEDENIETGLVAVVSALAALDRRFVLFLDDFDLCRDPATVALLSTFINQSPPSLSFVIAAREPPRLALPRLAAEGRVDVVSWANLLFTAEEASELFSAGGGRALTKDQIDRLLEVTEGWPMGLQLARLALDYNEPEKVIANYSGRNLRVSEYLTDDVLAIKDQETIDFLLRTSSLERFSADLCNDILEINNSQSVIEALTRSNTFIFSLDAEGIWYRYHHLFQAFLRKALGARDVIRLQKRAARWMRDNGEHQDAVHLAVATNDADFLAEILNAVCEEMVESGQHRLLRSTVSRLPRAIITRYPRLALYMVWTEDMLGNLQEAQHLLGLIEHAYDKNASLATDYSPLISLDDDILHKRMMIALSFGEVPVVLQSCDRLLNSKTFADPYRLASVHAAQISARYHMLDCSGVTGRSEQIIEQLPERGIKNGSIWTSCIIGLVYERRGQLEIAKSAFASALAIAQTLEQSPHLRGMAASFLANVAYEQNDVEQAQALLDTFDKGVLAGGIIDHFGSTTILRSRLLALSGEHEKAAKILESGIDFFAGRQLSRVRSVLVNEHTHQLLASGRAGEIAGVADRFDSAAEVAPTLPTPMSTTWDMAAALIWCRVAISRGDYRLATANLRRWIAHCRQRQCEQPALSMSLLLARSLALDGDLPGAMKLVKSGLTQARAMGMVRTLLDEGAWLTGVLADLYRAPTALQGDERQFAAELLKQTPAGRSEIGMITDLIVTPLSLREVDILQLVSTGLKGRYIASRLGLTEGTVKWYMQQIFDKLNVRTRNDAVARARAVGLLP